MTFGADRFVGTVGPVLLWTLPFLVLGWRRDRYWLLLAGLFPLFGVFWLLGPQWCRYFLPAVPLDAVLGASALANMRLPRFLTVLLGGMALFMVLPNLPGMDRALAVNTYMPAEVPYGPALGLQSGEEYRRRNLGLYAAAEYANSLGLPASTAVLAVPAMDTLPAWHTRYRVVDIWDNLHVVCTSQNGHEAPCYSITGDPLLRGLDRAGIGLLAIRHNDRFVMQTGALRLEDPMLREHFRMRGSGGGVFFFERNRLAAARWDLRASRSAPPLGARSGHHSVLPRRPIQGPLLGSGPSRRSPSRGDSQLRHFAGRIVEDHAGAARQSLVFHDPQGIERMGGRRSHRFSGPAGRGYGNRIGRGPHGVLAASASGPRRVEWQDNHVVAGSTCQETGRDG